MQTFERSDISCQGQTESGKDTAVFLVEAGGTLKNVIIGANQMEGVHCDQHDCTIENVWWDDVCEDALSIKGGSASSVSTVTGGGARSADDKVVQHNGFGTVKIDGFYGEDISKLYRSCGTCGDKQRKVSVSNVYVVNPGNAVVTVNKNYKDQATMKNIWVKSSKKTVKICQCTGTVTYTEPYTIKAGEVFDGKMQTFDRSDITCSEGEGQKDTAVFLVEAGGTLKNAIIGKNQKEGVHCDDHDCTIENVWWDDVCEDALSIKGGSASSVTTVTNCGARYASDKVVQHNGYGTVKIDGFYAQEFGKLYRSCGTCGDIPRKVFLSNVYAVDPLVSVVTVNKNYGDQAKFSNIYVKTSDGKNDVKARCASTNGFGTVKIDGFYAENFGKLYRSCGTCGDKPKKVILSNVYAVNPSVSIVTVNKNYNDQAKLSNIHVKSSKPKVKVCQWSQGGSSPKNLGDGPSGTLCQYSESDIHINE
ncbi:hypothetical protein JM16_009879 [Phytophthora kernoviae]|uniref:Probable pectate lyase F n=1 Tax=Phytophthora kernoviae TaxID=325452 RepID=A0A8T0LFR9_9STRA|nr:hypothetical protein JM16_009879 [Phytophthora kernoviae]